MSPSPPNDETASGAMPALPRIRDWLWTPWYAKFWWSAIPLWWLGMAASTRVEALETFYRGAIAGYLNILFFPVTALMVLGVGYVRERLDSFVGPGGGTPLSDEEGEAIFARRRWEQHNHLTENIGRGTDIFDPRSGPLWIGNPNNPNNGAYINPHTGRHS
ncbi:MAG: hypothetical protein C0494_06795 [Sphingobium sp.]|nr:hypothetical protein [Sphingobium sp.]